MPDNRPIGVFDSGLGGLTVVKEINKLLPFEDIVYFGDTGRVPYGTKSNETIIKYARQDEKFLLSKDVKLIVAACGTVSSVASFTKAELPVEFVEVISNSVKDSLKATKNKKIGILATSATINSGAHKKQILELCPEAKVIEQSGTLLVTLVEEGFVSPDDNAVIEILTRYLKPMIESNVDTIILGCTHFPLLADAIKKIMGEGVTLINMGTSAAEAVKELLENSDSLSENAAKGENKFFVSDKTQSFNKTVSALFSAEIDDRYVEQVDINSI